MRNQTSLRRKKSMRGALIEQLSSPTTGLATGSVVAPDFHRLPLEQLQAMQRAGLEILECYRALKKADMNIVGEVLRDSLNKGETFYEFNHYPDDDVYDRETHAQYYYHAHRSEAGEHGHFHCFLRPKGMPAGVAPIDYPATDPWPQGDEALAHLVAIAMDSYGYPTGLFTTNRWVTAEAWYPAEQVIRMLDYFVIDHTFPSWPVNRWISALFVLYRPHIEALLKRRDAVVWDWAEARPGEDVFEDRALDITSQMAISVTETLSQIAQAIALKHTT
ncbi:MAG TPA: hypothetical protein VFW53_05960 [Gallionella sp.]|nr:hypothetical protein [Gallionella sp.]